MAWVHRNPLVKDPVQPPVVGAGMAYRSSSQDTTSEHTSSTSRLTARLCEVRVYYCLEHSHWCPLLPATWAAVVHIALHQTGEAGRGPCSCRHMLAGTTVRELPG